MAAFVKKQRSHGTNINLVDHGFALMGSFMVDYLIVG